MTPRLLHESDSYGSCVICREFNPRTPEEYWLVNWPCAVERLRRSEDRSDYWRKRALEAEHQTRIRDEEKTQNKGEES